MKKLLYAWSALMVAAAIISFSSMSVFADFSMNVSLEKAGEIPESGIPGKVTDILSSGMISEDEDHHFYILDVMGNNNLGRSYDRADYFTDDMFLVYDTENWPNSCGLVKADGTVVLPCEAAIIETIKGTDRYLKISVATDPTDKDNAFLYTYSGWVAWPTEQSEYYDGYSQYYDLREAKYFEEWDDADPADIHGDYTRERVDDSTTAILDPDGNEVARLDFWPYEIYGEGELFSKKADDGTIVVDRNGTPINDLVFKTSPQEANGYLWAHVISDESHTVMDFNGKVYADGADHIRNVISKPYGFTFLYSQDSSSLLLYPDGTLAEIGDHYDNGGDLPFYIRGRDGEPDKVFVLNKGEYIVTETDYVSTVDLDSSLFLLVKLSGDQDYSLMSAADGSILLEKAGSKIMGSDAWVYALKDGVWTVYKVTVNY